MIDEFILADWPAPPNVRAFATTRNGGCSTSPYASLNLGTHVGDDPAAVAANRARLCEHLPDEPIWLNQVHGTQCLELDSAPARAGTLPPTADAAFTRSPGVVCAVLTADCLPILLCDTAGSVVAALHAGWRGLAAGVVEHGIASMAVPGERLMAWLGPAIGQDSFEVGDEVRAVFMAQGPQAADAFASKAKGKWLCDLQLLAKQRLAALGVRRIASADFCTVKDTGRFFSYRRDGITGRMATLIWLAQE